MTTFNILVVNPKDQETQIAVYDNYKLRYHDRPETYQWGNCRL